MDRSLWNTMDLDISDWPMVVKPESYFEALASGVVWGVATARYTNFHDMAHYLLEDAELSVECRRYLPEDDPPWDGAVLRTGTLVIDFVDKSGIHVGTSHGGSLTDGLVRTAVEFADDFIDSSLEVLGDADTPPDYFLAGSRYTDPVKPYVVFHEGDSSPIQASSFIHSPSKGVQITVGGKSSPGVNEIISATIQGVADVLGGLVQLGSLGGTIDALVSPLYTDCIAGGTVIDGPDGKERIDVLAERGGPFRVWSITPEGQTVSATATFAFRKGQAELFQFTLDDGRSISVTKAHRFLTDDGFVQAGELGVGSLISTVDGLRPVVGITPLGVDDFYDMHVPVWENYLAHGIWNHNTLLAWQSFKSSNRSNNNGWDELFSYFQDGAGKAFSIQAILVLRAGMWATKTITSWRVQVSDGAPYIVGDQGVGHFWLDDRVGLTLAGDTTGKIHMDRCRQIELAWGPESPPEWQISIGDDRIWEDPAQRALGKIERLQAGLHELGVWSMLAVIGGLMMLAAFFSGYNTPSEGATTTASVAAHSWQAVEGGPNALGESG